MDDAQDVPPQHIRSSMFTGKSVSTLFGLGGIASDAFVDDPDGYGRNQLWHAFMGGMIFMVAASIARIWLTDSAAMWAGGVVIALALLYLLIVEWWLQGWALPWDSIEDTCHFALGATFMALAISGFWLGSAAVMLCQGGIILFGEWLRS